MKKTFTIIPFLMILFSSYGQQEEYRDKGTRGRNGLFSISNNNSMPLKIIVDGRFLNSNWKGSNEFSMNLAPGYHEIRIFQYQKSFFGSLHEISRSDKQLYKGTVLIRPGFHLDFIINRFGKVFSDERRMNENYGMQPGGQHSYDYEITAMSNTRFEQLLQGLRNEKFDQTRITLAQQQFKEEYYTAAQVKALVQLFNFESNRLQMAKYCYQNTIDKENYFQLHEVLSFSSSKETLADFINAYKI